jgi:uncharacterized protein
LFPLGIVLLPGASLPLHIFEPRYRQLITDLINGTVPDRRFGVIGIRRGWEVGADNIDSLHDIGCSVRLQKVRQLPDGRFDLTSRGERRFQLQQVDREAAPYLMGTIRWLPDTAPDPDSDALRRHLVASALSAHERYHNAGLRGDRSAATPEDVPIEQLAYTLADLCVLDAGDRQTLLAETDPLARLRLIRRLLLRETEFLRTLRAIPARLGEFAQEPGTN